ncbi:MAG: flagellar hook assembly protein FlgD [Chloroflexota bacterium]
MNVSSIASSTTAHNAAASTSASGGLSGFDANAFMAILLAQLRNQNPLEPMDDKELVAQMTQLNSLEELKKISSGIDTLIKLMQAS